MNALKNCRVVCGALVAAAAAHGGCVAAPRAQLAASDSMDLLAASLRRAIEEYSVEIDAFDDERQRAVVDALVTRVQADPRDEAALIMHKAEFHAAMRRIDDDRREAQERRAAAIENVETLAEIAEGMRRLALESIYGDEETRRYLVDLASNATQPSVDQRP